ncbi:DUF1697 domain-containing protein [Devosia sp. ZB163]|uniref:DUF1697 domain-containing protein n=1 Tax=Devosia sp. ZB163 TaxID=3025938 RepID=UPI002362FDFA|nr:DUF1697 domain-containing protein [Devosia sp. ZB163]MDC9822570.1 DUF1697 domain-containing protein [Devosia sp. ZB163]
MAVCVALIRAIGPVTHAKMKMAALRDACAAAGLEDVSIVGNTGNVIFRTGHTLAEARKIVQGAVDGFGLGPANEVFVLTPTAMAAVVSANPFPEVAAERPSELGVCSFHKAPDWAPVLDWDGPELVTAVGAHLVVAYPKGVSTSKLNIEKRLGARMTQRNWTVFAGLAEKAAALAKA